MKYVIRVLLVVSFLVLSLPAFAAIVGSTDRSDGYILAKDTVIEDNFYVTSQTILSYGDILGDFTALGATIRSMGSVADDVLLIGADMELQGAIGGDARVLAGTVRVSDTITGDFAAIAGTVIVEPGAFIGSDTLILASDATLSGTFSGGIKGAADRVEINGDVGGDVKLISHAITIGKNARIAGDLVWEGENAPVVEDGALVLGEIRRGAFSSAQSGAKSSAPFLGILFMIKMVATLLALFLLVGLFPRVVSRATAVNSSLQIFLRSALIGICVMFGIPLIAGILIGTIVGSVIGFTLLFAYGLLLLFAVVLSGLIFGETLYRFIRRQGKRERTWQIAFVGVVLLALFGRIPLLGPIVGTVFFLVSLGDVATLVYQLARRARQPIDVLIQTQPPA